MKTVLYWIINHSESLIATIHNHRPSIYLSSPPKSVSLSLFLSSLHRRFLPFVDPTRIFHPPLLRSFFHSDGMMYRCWVVRYAKLHGVMNTKFNLSWRLKIELPRGESEHSATDCWRCRNLKIYALFITESSESLRCYRRIKYSSRGCVLQYIHSW